MSGSGNKACHQPSTALRITQAIDEAAARLSRSGRPALDAEVLFRGISGMSRASVLARRNELVPEDLAARYRAAVERRHKDEPVQYILGIAAFWRDEFVVNPSVLIPRPETEVLVEAVARRLTSAAAPTLLDLGTGSGCIALSLLRELPRARVTAVDLSEDALAVAAENARRLGLEARLDLRASRWFEAIEASAHFDAIVSNPPYVARAEQGGLPPEVRDFEPEMALFAAPSDELSSYREIIAGLPGRLTPSGLVAVEVGIHQSEGVAELMRAAGLESIEVLDDLARIPRVVIGRPR